MTATLETFQSPERAVNDMALFEADLATSVEARPDTAEGGRHHLTADNTEYSVANIIARLEAEKNSERGQALPIAEAIPVAPATLPVAPAPAEPVFLFTHNSFEAPEEVQAPAVTSEDSSVKPRRPLGEVLDDLAEVAKKMKAAGIAPTAPPAPQPVASRQQLIANRQEVASPSHPETRSQAPSSWRRKFGRAALAAFRSR